jgi:hypothetical protein
MGSHNKLVKFVSLRGGRQPVWKAGDEPDARGRQPAAGYHRPSERAGG